MSYVKEGGLRDAEEGDVCCVLVPGTNLQTFSLLPNRQGSAEVADWTKSSSAIGKLLASKFPRSKIICFMWPRSHHQKVRYEAATELTRVLNELRHKWRRIIVVGHSHGGNIAVQAAYKAPFARTELITLNTPFVMERQLTEEKIAPRIMIFFSATVTFLLGLAGVATYFLKPDWYLVLVCLFVGWIIFLKNYRDSIGSLFGKALLARKAAVHETFVTPRVRKGARCLVVVDSRDEILNASNEVRAWISWHVKAKGHRLMRLIQLVASLFILAFIHDHILEPLKSSSIAASIIDAALLFLSFYVIACFIPIIYPMIKFVAAFIALVFVRPPYTVGFSMDGLYVDALLRALPAADAGAFIERFEFHKKVYLLRRFRGAKTGAIGTYRLYGGPLRRLQWP